MWLLVISIKMQEAAHHVDNSMSSETAQQAEAAETRKIGHRKIPMSQTTLKDAPVAWDKVNQGLYLPLNLHD